MLDDSLGGLFHDVTERRIPIDWAAVEQWRKTSLPRDYRELCDTYGTLYVGDWVWIHAPVTTTGYQSHDRYLSGIKAETRDACDASGLPEPIFHPTKGGLLPFGSTRRSEGLFWETTDAAPDQWTVTVLVQGRAYGSAQWLRSGLTLTQFLEALVTTGVSRDGVSMGPLAPVAAWAYGGAPASPWSPPVRPPTDDARMAALRSGQGLTTLRILVPPPPGLGSSATVPEAWHLASELGSRLPREYVDLMSLYGPGLWGDWLRMLDPQDPGRAGVWDYAQRTALGYRELRAEFPDQLSLPMWPESGGFLAFADTIDGDVLGWLVEGDPDDWSLVWLPRHRDQGPPLAAGLVDTLLGWLRGHGGDCLPGPDPDEEPLDAATFTSHAS